jgi:effector-binding domain-containing protein
MAKYESPQYEVLTTQGSFELRLYDAFSTSMVHEANLRGYSGFGVLFRYISGDNQASQPISMTIPVFSEQSDNPTMEFVIPKAVEAAGIPAPNNNEVVIKHYPKQLVAVVSFRGKATKEKLPSLTNELKTWITSQSLVASGPVRLAQYDGPYMPTFLRTNEVLIPVERPA